MKKMIHFKRRLKNSSQRGVAILMAMVLASLLSVFAISITYLVVREQEMSTDLELSARAYTAAEGGIEHLLNQCTLGSACAKSGSFSYENPGDATYSATITEVLPAGSGEWSFASTGTFGGISRKVELRMKR